MSACYNNPMYVTDGSSALAPVAAPNLVLIEGGKGLGCSRSSAKYRPVTYAGAKPSALECVFAILVAVLISISVFAVDASINSCEQAALDGVETTVVSVKAGDSLWGLASEYGVDGCGTHKVVEWIRTQNNLTSSNIYAGQQLIVPSSANL